MTRIRRKRGFFGWIFLLIFLGFNAFMALWLLSYWSNIGGALSSGSAAGRTGAAIGVTIASGVIFFFWAAGAVITGLLALLTRGQTTYIEEAESGANIWSKRLGILAVGAIVIIGGPMLFGGRDQRTTITPSIDYRPQSTSSTEPTNPTANFFRPDDSAKQAAAPPREAATVQTRLIELGYLGGSADGVWGAKSRAALRAFKSAHGLDSDDVWNDAVSKRLVSKNVVRAPLPLAKAQ